MATIQNDVCVLFIHDAVAAVAAAASAANNSGRTDDNMSLTHTACLFGRFSSEMCTRVRIENGHDGVCLCVFGLRACNFTVEMSVAWISECHIERTLQSVWIFVYVL